MAIPITRNGKTRRSKIPHLIPDQLLQSHTVQLFILKTKIKCRPSDRFIVGVMYRPKEWMFQCVGYVNAFFGVDL